MVTAPCGAGRRCRWRARHARRAAATAAAARATSRRRNATITAIKDGQRFSRASAPRTLHVSVAADPSGLHAVKLRLTRTDGRRCTYFSGGSERFKLGKRGRCGARERLLVRRRSGRADGLPAAVQAAARALRARRQRHRQGLQPRRRAPSRRQPGRLPVSRRNARRCAVAGALCARARRRRLRPRRRLDPQRARGAQRDARLRGDLARPDPGREGLRLGHREVADAAAQRAEGRHALRRRLRAVDRRRQRRARATAARWTGSSTSTASRPTPARTSVRRARGRPRLVGLARLGRHPDDVPAVVGSYPEPFLHGIDGRRLPTRIECTEPKSAAWCSTIAGQVQHTR